MRFKTPNIIQLIWISTLIMVMSNCTNHSSGKLQYAFEKSGNNRSELEKVLHHYTITQPDSLKYAAAVFLIENMSFYSSHIGTAIFDPAFAVDRPYFLTQRQKDSIQSEFLKEIDYLKKHNNYQDSIRVICDVNIIKGTELMAHIDHSVKVWREMSKFQTIDFNTFCEYILPYRSKNEPIDFESQISNYKEYGWLIDSIKNEKDLVEHIRSIIKQKHFTRNLDLSKVYPWEISYKQLNNFGFYKNCNDAVYYYVNLLRSVGIPAAEDYVEQWGNHQFRGHSWLSVLIKDQWYSFDASDGKNVKQLYKDEAIPKVYRRTFHVRTANQKAELNFRPNGIDVTNEYRELKTYKVKLNKIAPNSLRKASVFIYNRNTDWRKIGDCDINDGYAILENFGSRCFYIVGYVSNDCIVPITSAFHIDRNCNLRLLDSRKETLTEVQLTRKYPLYSPRNTTKVDKWMNCLEGNTIRLINNGDDYGYSMDLPPCNSLNKQSIEVANTNCFSQLQFIRNNKYLTLAELVAIDANNNPVPAKATVLDRKNEVMELYEAAKITDGKPLTFVSLFGTAKSIILDFNAPTRINRIEYLPHNDGNNVEYGDTYELFLWNDQWISLGSKVAVDNFISYANLPLNGLYLLRNLTKGSEEYPFVLDMNGTQIWPGMND